jgi:hypothetical protein
MKWVLTLIAVFAFTAFAADPNGSWKANIDTPNGAIEATFTFKVADGKLTGTVNSSMGGESPISEAKLDGDNISFAVVRKMNDQEFRLNYKGTVAEKEIKLTLTIPAMGDQTFDIVAKKIS